MTESPGARVKARREALPLSRKDLAERAGIDRMTLSKIEDEAGYRVTSLRAVEHALDEAEAVAGKPVGPSHACAWDEVAVDGLRAVLRGPDGHLWVAAPLASAFPGE